MGRHHQKRKRKAGSYLLLGLSALSVGSPLGLLSLVQTPKPDQDSSATLPLPVVPTKETSSDTPRETKEEAVKQAVVLPTTRPTTGKTVPTPEPPKAKAQIRTSTPTLVTPSPPPTRTSRPTVAQRQIQRATTATITPVPTPPSTTATPKRQIPRQTTTTPPPTTTKKTTTPPSAPPPAPTNDIVTVAKRYVNTGIPYRMGGDSLTTGMDCSHFVWRVLKEAGFNVPYRDSGGLASWVTRTSNPQPGDLVLFSGHVGIYVSPGMMIDQGKSGGAFLREIYKQNFIGYGRMPI